MKYIKLYEEVQHRFDHLNRMVKIPVYETMINKLEGDRLLKMGKHFTIIFDQDIEKCRDSDYNGVNGFNDSDLNQMYYLYEQADILFHTNSADSDDSFDFRDECKIKLHDEPHVYRKDLLSVYREVLLEVVEQIIYIKKVLGEDHPFDELTGNALRKINQ